MVHTLSGPVRTVYKPAGTPVFPFHDGRPGPSVWATLPDHGHDWPAGFDRGIAHRLDVPTSGALVVADDPDELEQIRAHFAERRLWKTYRLRVARDVSWDENSCDRPIAHDKRRRRKMIVQRGSNTPHRGRWLPARTWFRRVHGSLFEARMQTGVMHQIRVHAAFLGIPLRGDRLYGGGGDGAFLLHHVGLEGGHPHRAGGDACLGYRRLRSRSTLTGAWSDVSMPPARRTLVPTTSSAAAAFPSR